MRKTNKKMNKNAIRQYLFLIGAALSLVGVVWMFKEWAEYFFQEGSFNLWAISPLIGGMLMMGWVLWRVIDEDYTQIN